MHSSRPAPSPDLAAVHTVFFDAEGTLWVPRAGRTLDDFWADPTPANAQRTLRVTPGIRTLLTRLGRRGKRLVVLSRHNETLLPRLLETFRLAHHFEAVLINGDKGERAALWLQAHGLPTASALMVGDRADLDVVPLERKGIQAVLLDRPYNRDSGAARVNDPRELLPALRRPAQGRAAHPPPP